MIRYFFKSLIICFFVFFVAGGINAQQEVQFSQAHFNKLFYNPAFSGVNEALNVNAFYRTQWVGIPGNPEYQSITADMPIYRANSGIGIVFLNDKIGAEQNTNIAISYAYITKVGQSTLSFGLSAGMNQKSIDGTILRAPQGQYEPNVINHDDDFIPVGKVSAFAQVFGIGVLLKNEQYFIGISANRLFESSYNFNENGKDIKIYNKRHINLQAGYLFELTDDIDLQTSILLKSDLVEHQLDLNVMIIYNDFLWGGLSYRGYNKYSQDAIVGLFGININKSIKFGYSYDFNLSNLKVVNSGSHELFINYTLPMAKPGKGKIINNPRFLSY
jgi:type IX secretion system PorP/SprF family membrane protein